MLSCSRDTELMGQPGLLAVSTGLYSGCKAQRSSGAAVEPSQGRSSGALLEQETRRAQPAYWRGGKTKLGSDQQDRCHENRALTATAWLPRQPSTSAGAARDFPPWLPAATAPRDPPPPLPRADGPFEGGEAVLRRASCRAGAGFVCHRVTGPAAATPRARGEGRPRR